MSLELLLVIAALALLARFGAGKLLGNLHMPAGIKVLTQTGTLFIAIGWAAGPHGLGLVRAAQVDAMHPVLVLCIGWIGFLYGCHFEWRRVRRVPRGYIKASLSEALVVMVVIAAVSWVAVPWLFAGIGTGQLLGMVGALTLCGAGTAPAGVFLLARNKHISRHDIRALQLLTAFDELPSVLGLAILLAWAPHPLDSVPPIGLLALQVGLGVVVGIAAHLVFPSGVDARDRSVVLIGVAGLAAGAADVLVVSPLFVSLIAGVVFMNVSQRGEAAFGVMSAPAHTLFAVFLMVAGSMMQFSLHGALLLAAVAYVLVRAVGKIVGAELSHRLFIGRSHLHPLLGTGMLFQGGVSLVIAIEISGSVPESVGGPMLTIVVAAVFLNELLGNSLADRALATRR